MDELIELVKHHRRKVKEQIVAEEMKSAKMTPKLTELLAWERSLRTTEITLERLKFEESSLVSADRVVTG